VSIEKIWTPEMVWERVSEALETLAAMPGDRPAGYRSAMPQPVRGRDDAWLSGGRGGDPLGLYGNDDDDRVLVIAARTRERVSRMDEVFNRWVWWLPEIERVAVLGMASGAPRRRIARKIGCSRYQVYRLKDRGLRHIATRLSENSR